MSKAEQNDQVRHYYDRNTRRFLAHGEGGKEFAIRRSVWAPEVANREEAMQYVNRKILGEMAEIDAQGVVDLGCGVGGSILYLASRKPATYTGVTLSPVQADIGRELLEDLESATIRSGDLSSEEFWSALNHPIDLAFAVESLVHVPNIEPLFEAAARRMTAKSRFVIMDDFLAEREPESKQERRWLREFRDGWRAAGLRRVSALEGVAAGHGFTLVRADNFTPYLELDRPRDIAARIFIDLFRWWPGRGAWFSNLYGGNALQLCLKHGVVRYRYLVLERS